MKLSVIVPVFNPPANLFDACVASVLAQSYPDWELLIVDDGSDDPTVLQRLHELPMRDRRIRVHRQSNAGPSRARNLGTSLATGDYLTYLDADDELTPYALDEAATAIEQSGAQLVMGYLQRVRRQEDKVDRQSGIFHSLQPDEINYLYRAIISLAEGDPHRIISKPDSEIKNGPIARFVERTLAVQVPFPSGVDVSEDTIWNLDLFQMVQSVCVSDSIWYWYWVAHDSTSRGFRADSVEQAQAMFRLLEERFGHSPPPEVRDLLLYRVVAEVLRASERYYSRRQAKLSPVARIRAVRKLLRSTPLSKARPSAVFGYGPVRTVKYLLCWTGLAPFYWWLHRNTTKFAARLRMTARRRTAHA